MKRLAATAHFALGIDSSEQDKSKEYSQNKSGVNLLSSLFLLLFNSFSTLLSTPSFPFDFHLFSCSIIASNQIFSFYFIRYFPFLRGPILAHCYKRQIYIEKSGSNGTLCSGNRFL
jgi:hypothetical protein